MATNNAINLPLGSTTPTIGNLLIPNGNQWASISLTGDATINDTGVLTLNPATNSTPGTFGSATQVGTFTVNNKGLITSAGNTTISGVSPGGAAGGDLSGTYPNPTVAKINGATLGTTTASSGNILIGNGTQWATNAVSGDATLNSSGALTLNTTTNSTPGSYGSATQVGTFTVNSKGLVTASSNVPIVGTVIWSATATSITLTSNTGTITTGASLVTLTLPASPAVGSVFYVTGQGAGGWKIAQAANQIIHCGNVASTAGVGGSVASSNAYDCIMLVCVLNSATIEFTAVSMVGNLTIV